MAKKVVKKSTKKKPPRRPKKRAIEFVGLLHTGSRDRFEELVGYMEEAATQHLRNNGRPADEVRSYGGGHYANDDIGLLEEYADELVNDTNVGVMVAAGGPQSAIAAKEAAEEADETARRDVSIVFTTVADPKGLKLVDNLTRPGGNLTGMAGRTSESDPMRLRFLHGYISRRRPGRTKVGVLINPGRQGNRGQYRLLKDEARKLRLTLVPKRANSLRGIERAFRVFRDPTFLGVVVTADSFFNSNRDKVIAEAARDGGIPAIYQWREFVEEGGLMSYGPSIRQAYEEAGRYAARIILGEKPAKMKCSVPPPASFRVVINKNTAGNLSLDVPDDIDGEPVDKFPSP